jgi:hypothetical protein
VQKILNMPTHFAEQILILQASPRYERAVHLSVRHGSETSQCYQNPMNYPKTAPGRPNAKLLCW